jgi:hypothetical protein
MWKELNNSPLIYIEKKKEGLVGYAVQCLKPDGMVEGRSCVFNTNTKQFTHLFVGMSSLDDACTAAELIMKVQKVFTDED